MPRAQYVAAPRAGDVVWGPSNELGTMRMISPRVDVPINRHVKDPCAKRPKTQINITIASKLQAPLTALEAEAHSRRRRRPRANLP